MKGEQKLMRFLLWSARIWGTLSILLLVFASTEVIKTSFNVTMFESNSELIAFIFFPGLTVLGLIMAFKWAGLGGSLSCLGLIVGLLTHSKSLDVNVVILILGLPGLLYLTYWYMKRRLIVKHTT
jgi:hypothetical protein